MKVQIRNAFDTVAETPDVRIFIDIFRASTTSIALFESNIESLSIANEMNIIEHLSKSGHLVVSEVIDIGMDNSPSLIRKTNLQKRKVVLKTANLTTAIEKNIFQGPMLIGCFNNLTAVANLIRQHSYQFVEIIPAGLMAEQKPLVEDTECARTLQDSLLSQSKPEPDQKKLTEHIAQLKQTMNPPSHYWEDLTLAIQLDISRKVPLIEIEAPNLFRCSVLG